jgi:dTDP-4-amino-4,6-dideoxygalactose transaminase
MSPDQPTRIRLSRSIVGEEEKKALAGVIEEGYLGMGRFVQEFEGALGEYLGVSNVVCVNSGTAALHLGLMAAGVGPGDEVLVQSLTYVACFQAITAAGARPVACEVLPETCTIDLGDAEKRLTGKTKAVMPVHYASRAGDLDAVYGFAGRHGLRVVEDAAHALGSLYKGRRVGSFGDVACFSFDGIKNITSGEGGAVATSDNRVAEHVRDARLLGVHKDTEMRYRGLRSWEFDVMHQGYRFHMSNLFAAIGLVQLGRLEGEFKPARQGLARRYHEEFGGTPHLELFPDDYDKIVPHIFPVRVLDGRRDGLREHLLENGVECGIHYYPNHRLTYFKATGAGLPVTDGLYEELLTLPLHPGLTGEEQTKVINTVKGYLNE